MYFCHFTTVQEKQMVASDPHMTDPEHTAHIATQSHSTTAGELVLFFRNHPVRHAIIPLHNVDNVFNCNGGRNRHIANSSSSMSVFQLMICGSSASFVVKSGSLAIGKGRSSVTDAVADYGCSHSLQHASWCAALSTSFTCLVSSPLACSSA